MNGTSGFQEMRSSISRSSTNRFLDEQQHQFGTGFWQLLRTHDRIDLSIGISTESDKAPDTIFRLYCRIVSCVLAHEKLIETASESFLFER
jgi:hypothetical protein